MRQRTLKALAMAGLLGCTSIGMAQVSLLTNNITGPGPYVGCDGGSNQPLRLMTKANYPIDFYTADIFRARINPRIQYPSLNTFANIPADGFTLITPDNGFLSQAPRGPFSRLHLAEGGTGGNAEQWGYRPWQKNGITFTGNEDQGYVGQKYRHGGGTGETDMVMQWSDNPGNWKGDRLRFIFTGGYDPLAPTGRNSLEGEEGVRLYPTVENGINVGIGDFFAGNLIDPNITDPTERLDVLDGRVRIRQLPSDPEADNLLKFLVVDDTPSPSGERGVVKWRYLPTTSTPNCDWELAGNSLTTAWRPVGTNGSCPEASWKLGVGTQIPNYKMNIAHSEANGAVSGGLYVDLRANSTSWRSGIGSIVQPVEGGTLQYASGVAGYVFNLGLTSPGTADAYGVYGHSNTNQDLYVRYSKGVMGYAENSAGTINAIYGGDFFGNNGGPNGSTTFGVAGRGQSTHAEAVCYGVYGIAAGPDDTNGPNGHTKWAAYFPGYTYSPGGVWSSSDVQLKQNIADMPMDTAVSLLEQLAPKTYDFNQDQFSFMHLPTEHQYGLIAQEVESVLPELVTNIHQPAMLDSTGAEISPAIDFKAMNYQGLIPLLVAGFQAQRQQIAAMQQQLDQCCASNSGMAPQGSSGQKSAPAPEDVREQRLVIQPNPFTDHTTLGYYVPQAGQVSLQFSTSDGKPMGTLREEQAEPGAYTYEWNTSKLSSGTYFCTYMLDGAVVVKRAVKVAR